MFHNALRKLLGLVEPSTVQQPQPVAPKAPAPQALPPVSNKQATVLRNMSFSANGKPVGEPIHDNNIYANTGDFTTTSPQNVIGHTYTGNPVKSATMYSSEDPRKMVRNRLRID